MKNIPFFIFLLLSIILYNIAAAQKYVTVTGAGLKDGSTWDNASDDLQKVINGASSGEEIWVARGTYIPIRPADDYSSTETNITNRSNAFVITKDIKLYGGFIGGESSLSERSWYENKTILSGDLKGNDYSNLLEDNTYHVLIVNTTGTFTLDGFIITGGNANGSGQTVVNSVNIDESLGGGIYNNNSNIHLTNLILTNNSATNNGGGIYNNNSTSSILTNLLIVKNTAANGGGIYNNDCTNLFLTNLTIADNIATIGSEIANNNSSPEIRNSVIWNNGENVVNDIGSTTTYYYSLAKSITTNVVNDNIDGSTNPMFTNANSYMLSLISPLINKGSDTYYQLGTPDLTSISSDITGRTRFHGTSTDIGAFEYLGDFQTIIPNEILYVNKNATGSNNGSSWTDASIRLCDALKASEALNYATPGTVKQIWVAKGTYYSIHKSAEVDSEGKFTTARDNAFSMVKDVKLYGGFNGTETNVNQRDWVNNETTLSGDFNNDDNTGNPATLSENAYHTIFAAGEMGSALLDGFTIIGGYANYNKFVSVNGVDMYSAGGAGLYIKNGSPHISNLIIKNNSSTYRGGGALIVNSTSELSNITITQNSAPNGGGVYLHNSDLKITSTIISKNTATTGGGMVNRDSNSTITNMLVAGNTATVNGGGLYNHNASPIYTNTTVAENNAAIGSGMYNGGISNPVGRNSIIWGNIGNSSVYSEDGSENISSYCLVEGETQNDENGNISGDTNPLFDANYQLSPASPLSNKGSNAYFNAGADPDLSMITTDLAGNLRIRQGVVDLGAYESDNTSHEADLQNLYINGVLHDINQLYVLPCDYARNVVDVKIEIPINAIINIDKEFQIDVSKPSLYKVNFTITSLDGSQTNNYTLAVEKYFPFNELVVQKWNNTLAINNNLSTNGGHTFTACTWYKNGVEVSNKLFYSAGSSSSHLLNESDEFYLVLTRDNGDVLHTCPGSVTLKRTQVIAYPNPIQSGNIFNLKVDTDDTALQNGTIDVYDLKGMCLSTTKVQGATTPLIIQGAPGVYIVRLCAEGITEDIKVIVQ